jgi:hypothetical protein
MKRLLVWGDDAPSRAPVERCVHGRAPLCAVALAATVLASGCASQNVDAQWADPQFSGRSLVGAKVFVVCQAYDLAVRRVCADQIASELVAHGATPVLASDNSVDAGNATRPTAESYLPAAKEAGASAILRTTINTDYNLPPERPSVGIGIGGFGGSWGRGGGVGVGIGVPIGGGGAAAAGYSANGAFTDVSSGRLMWTARASTEPSTDVNQQVATLARRVLLAAQKAGLF